MRVRRPRTRGAHFPGRAQRAARRAGPRGSCALRSAGCEHGLGGSRAPAGREAAEDARVGAGRGQLRERSLHASAVLLNRAVGAPPPWVGALGDKIASEPALGDALAAYRREYAAREGQTRHALGALGGMVPKKTPLAALPALKSSDPREILITIAGELGGSALVG